MIKHQIADITSNNSCQCHTRTNQRLPAPKIRKLGYFKRQPAFILLLMNTDVSCQLLLASTDTKAQTTNNELRPRPRPMTMG